VSSQPTTAPVSFSQQLGTAWNAFWFLPADGRPLAVIRILTAVLGLVLWSSYAADLQRWFGPQGIVSPDVMATWRKASGVSLFDAATTAASLWALYGLGFAAFAALLVGLGTRIAAAAAAVLWVSILHRGPMLISPADDVLTILLWCLVIGRSGDHLSLDAWLRRARGGAEAVPSVSNRLALSLMAVHASGITVAAILAQLKGDIWWDGTAAWWLLSGREQAPVSLMAAMAASDYLTNLLTHAITLFEIAFAAGVWVVGLRRSIVALGIVAWPLIGWLAGDLAWGCGMATLGLAWAPETVRRWSGSAGGKSRVAGPG
jgi:hypothetical protein